MVVTAKKSKAHEAAAKTKSPELAEQASLVRQVYGDAEQVRELAEKILMAVEEPEFPSFDGDELTILRAAGFDTDKEIQRELERMQVVKKAMAAAGSAVDYEAVKQIAEEASKIFAAESPAIMEQIQRLQDRLDELADNELKAAKDLACRDEARERLRLSVPKWVRTTYEKNVAIIRRQHGELLALIDELGVVDHNLAPAYPFKGGAPPSIVAKYATVTGEGFDMTLSGTIMGTTATNRAQQMTVAQTEDGKVVNQAQLLNKHGMMTVEKWEVFKRFLRSTIRPKLVAQIEELTPAYEADMQENESLLDYYVARL